MPTSDAIRILLADDHHVVREGLVALLNFDPDLRVVAEAADGRQAVDRYFECTPDVTILDLRMPEMDAVEAIQAIRGRDPNARLIVLTTFDGDNDIFRALQAGAQAYLLKEADRSELVACVRAVAAGERWVRGRVADRLDARAADDALTARELEVLRLLAMGHSNRDIGLALDVTEGTIKVHVNHIFRKLGVRGRTEAVAVATRRGLVRLI
jgi:DNA-binding NarL/FixJ family response regulator